jgi:hypothetical protein
MQFRHSKDTNVNVSYHALVSKVELMKFLGSITFISREFLQTIFSSCLPLFSSQNVNREIE